MQPTKKQPELDTWPLGPLTVQQVFGPDPSQITFHQNGGNTCYLLSAIDSILHHPHCNAILEKIGFEKTKDGYIVTFPGQQQLIFVSQHDIQASGGVQSDNLGIRLLEAAYFKIPDPQIQWGRFDTTNFALHRIFGNQILVTAANAVRDYVPIDQSFQLARLLNTEADVWTATRRVKDAFEQPVATGNHYYSIRPVPGHPEQVQIVNPFNTSQIAGTLTIEQLNEDYQVEMSRLRL